MSSPYEGMFNSWEYWQMELDEMISKLGESKTQIMIRSDFAKLFIQKFT